MKRFLAALATIVLTMSCLTASAGELPHDSEAAQTSCLTASAGDSEAAKAKPYALVISGGVSLGAYEAGLNWSIIKGMRIQRKHPGKGPRELRAVAGASAGGLNALITAITWCLDEGFEDSIKSNLFRDTWVPVGLDSLFPKNMDAYTETDGLLSRKPINERIADIINKFRLSTFREDCSVPIGLTVTRSRVELVPFKNQKIKVSNDRFVIPLMLVTNTVAGDEARTITSFKNFPVIDGSDHEKLRVGNVIYLMEHWIGDSIEIEDVFDAAKATSAFPVAFGPQRINYCIWGQGQTDKNFCPKGYVPADSGDTFVDGGVFDNIPLGLSREIMLKLGMDNTAHYIYMDPDKRRGVDMASAQPEDHSMKKGLAGQLMFAKGAYSTARQYELYNTLRNNSWETSMIHVTNRSPAVTGAYLSSFGAFFAKTFRLYDYYAGVYDGVMFLAIDECEEEAEEGAEADPVCVARSASCWYKQLVDPDKQQVGTDKELVCTGKEKDMSGVWLFHQFLENENPELYRLMQPRIGNTPSSEGVSDNLVAVAMAFSDLKKNKESGLKKFMLALKARKFNFEVKGDENAAVLLSENNGWDDLALRASIRLLDKEVAAGADGKQVVSNVFAATGYLSKSAMERDLDGCHIKSASQNPWVLIIPYEASMNLNGRGWALSYEGRCKFNDFSIFNLRASFGQEGAREMRYAYQQIDARYSFEAISSIPLVGKKLSMVLSSIEVGPSVTYAGYKGDNYLGGSVALGFLGGLFRLTYGERVIGEGDYPYGEERYMYFGVTDIPGLAYWAGKAMGM